MRLNPQAKDELASAVAENVPPIVLSDVVAIQGVVGNYEELVKLASDDPALNARTVATRVLDEYQNLDQVEVLIRGLLRRDPGNSRFASRIAELVLKNIDPVSAGVAAAAAGVGAAAGTGGPAPINGAAADSNLQAAIAKRAQMLRSPDLLAFMSENEGKICVIATEVLDGQGGRRFTTGTGFLIGPDLVLTARHVLGDHIAGNAQNPAQTGKRCAFFDHTDGPPISEPDQASLPPRVRRVEFHPTQWLVQVSDAFPGDGTFDPTPPQIQALQQSLDMVLIRLVEPIGNYSRRRTGGARRGWIEFPPPATPAGLATDDRIIIPQHPYGHPQQIDFGRYRHQDPSTTRIRYDTETEHGTSGAPCFNQGFQLVGMHNAWYKVPPNPKLNQAIRFDHILNLVPAHAQPPPAASKLWSVSDREDNPEVIVGRDAFQDWIKSANTDDPTGIVQRAYVIEGVRPKCGKSFSARILQAARRDLREHVVVLSQPTVPVPQSASDFLRLVSGQLRLPVQEIDAMPGRPSDLLSGGGDGDKLDLWLSKDLPSWFARVLGKHRVETVDLKEDAKAYIQLQRQRGITPSPEDLKLAASPGPVLQSRTVWERVWIVLDDVTEDTVSRELKELLPSLLGVGLTEQALDPELRRLRWVFLGWKPQFLAELTGEKLDHAVIKDEDIAVCVRALVESLDAQVSPDQVDTGVFAVRFTLKQPLIKADYDNLEKRLATLQGVIGNLRDFLKNDLLSS